MHWVATSLSRSFRAIVALHGHHQRSPSLRSLCFCYLYCLSCALQRCLEAESNPKVSQAGMERVFRKRLGVQSRMEVFDKHILPSVDYAFACTMSILSCSVRPCSGQQDLLTYLTRSICCILTCMSCLPVLSSHMCCPRIQLLSPCRYAQFILYRFGYPLCMASLKSKGYIFKASICAE